MEHYNVKIDAFEGPLDLLLHLINRLEIDIYDIPVAEITEQYLLYIHTIMFDDSGFVGEGAGERALKYVAGHKDITVLGIIGQNRFIQN